MPIRNVFVAADHGGWFAKRRLTDWLRTRNIRVIDLGPERRQPRDDYPVWAARLADAVRHHPGSLGIAFCRSGVGMAIAANKRPGIRAVQGWSTRIAARSRTEEQTNILSLAADYHSEPEMRRIVMSWLGTEFKPIQRYRRRLGQLRRLERNG